MTMPTPAALRDQLAEMVIKDLLGPAAGPEEELHHYEDHVFKRYLVGMLAPEGSEVAGEELDDLAVGESDGGRLDEGMSAGIDSGQVEREGERRGARYRFRGA